MTHDQREAPQITMADIRKHTGEGMVSEQNVIDAANELLKEIYLSPPPAAGWNEAIEAAKLVVERWSLPTIQTPSMWLIDKAGIVAEIESLRRETPAPEEVDRPDDGDGVHLWHCNQGHYLNVCKYGDDDCPALSTPPAAAESNASVDARLREALARGLIGDRSEPDGYWIDIKFQTQEDMREARRAIKAWRVDAIKKSLAAVGDEAKKSEGGVEGHASVTSTAALNETSDLSASRAESAPRDVSVPAGIKPGPSDPTAERREIVDQDVVSLILDMGRVIRSLDDENKHSEFWTQDEGYVIDGRFPR